MTRAAKEALSWLRRALPEGRTLSDDAWWGRHRAVLVLLWAHVPGLFVFGLVRGYDLTHSVVDVAGVALAGALATSTLLGRRARSVAATIGVLTASAILVHLSGGVIETHFHFFVMVPVVALYQDWRAFLTAIGYVLVEHGVVGAISPGSVYNHFAAQQGPWKWAAIHAVFVSGISVICVINWRLNELELDRRRDAESDLLDALSVLSATLESTADGILVVNRDGAITTFNERFVEMWRLPAEVMSSRDDDRAIACVLDQLKDPDGFLSKVRDLYGDPEAESYDNLEFKDGRVFERYSKPQLVGGVCVGRVWSFRDVTTARKSEAALRDAVLELEARDQAKNVFLTAVSHELRTPLTSVVGLGHTLLTRESAIDPDRRRDLLQRLTRNAERLQELLLNLLDLDRLSRGILEPRRRPTGMRELVERVVENLDLEGHMVSVRVEPLTALVDAAMIERVVENLLVNASKHTPKGTPITVRVSRTWEGILLAVDDEGPGVSDTDKAAIFEPFKQGVVKEHSPGTGIGLALVSQFVALHGGRAWVQDRPGGGASFRALLPGAAVAVERIPA